MSWIKHGQNRISDSTESVIVVCVAAVCVCSHTYATSNDAGEMFCHSMIVMYGNPYNYKFLSMFTLRHTGGMRGYETIYGNSLYCFFALFAETITTVASNYHVHFDDI